MKNKIMNYFDSNNLFYQHQYGFRPKRTTSHPIIQLRNKCASDNNLKPKHLTAAILCDLSKAFDVINHNILIRKLDHYGIRGIAKTWMVNYLSKIKQYVEFGEEKSEHCIVQCGGAAGVDFGTPSVPNICKWHCGLLRFANPPLCWWYDTVNIS